jgi:hypothetical protein
MIKPRASKIPHAASVTSIYCKMIERLLMSIADRYGVKWPPEEQK